ncbi:uncharacterized protein LOC9629881 [Selaginella moellendorffii]|uniref:uncharacterized protein LOC9629881 n=1 Tax=Selaginella moellendorffii TaxID=88036 RepID=UPI000D1C7514|nr:uncharacterized protein LOC9629881 [Selaginella moellendorffii]|eukprot:XP_024519484.1 uncharacterized protein LOC9629881 [Selaginella moellendorffii]
MDDRSIGRSQPDDHEGLLRQLCHPPSHPPSFYLSIWKPDFKDVECSSSTTVASFWQAFPDATLAFGDDGNLVLSQEWLGSLAELRPPHGLAVRQRDTKACLQRLSHKRKPWKLLSRAPASRSRWLRPFPWNGTNLSGIWGAIWCSTAAISPHITS